MRRADAATVFGCASVLLSYPGDGYGEDLEAVDQAVARLPNGTARGRLATATTRLRALPSLAAQAAYVDTFDLRRGTGLHLTYYGHGDTRERGMALAALADAYRAAGFAVAPGELPDFLPALLELAAASSAGAALLKDQRVALDALRAELDKSESPYAGVVAAVCNALPTSTRRERDALRRYHELGPPSERVGLEPFAPPEMLGQRIQPEMPGSRQEVHIR